MEQLVVFEVRTTAEVQLAEAYLELDSLGTNQLVTLSDDGSRPGDVAYDGVWEGNVRGKFAADLQARLVVKTSDGEAHTLYQGVILLDDSERALVAWRLAIEGKDVTAWRTATDWPASKPLIGGENYVFIGFAWLLVLIVFVGMLFESAPHRAGKAS